MTNYIDGFLVKFEVAEDSLNSAGAGIEMRDDSPGFWVAFREAEHEAQKIPQPPLLYNIQQIGFVVLVYICW